MPLYEYYCPTCAQKFELLRPMSRADEAASCPAGHPAAQRVLSVFAFTAGVSGMAASFGEAGDAGACACDAGGSCACSGDF